MKKIFLSSKSLLTLLALLPTVVSFSHSAEKLNFKNQNELSLQTGALFFEGNSRLKNQNLLGLRYGRYLSDHVAIEGSMLAGRNDLKNGNDQVDILSPSVSALYHFGDKPFRPFVDAGLGLLKIMPDLDKASTHATIHIGGGAKWHFTDSFFFRGSADYLFDGGTTKGQNNILLTLGIGWKFQNPFGCDVLPTPLDSDHDGVIDEKDKCPNTPAGTKVDEKGCPLDSDGDGVPDSIDECPDTSTGTKVNEKGCEVDVQAPQEHQWILHDIRFAFNSTRFDTKSRIHLEEVSSILLKNLQMQIEIQGHADIRGPKSYNQTLSERRAMAAKRFLVGKGVDETRIRTKGFGVTRPIATNQTPEGRALNRRIEFVILSR